ncbi:PP2C family protein-serine/threonine phosphatase [Stackebrandtia nassauensis]|uniref:Protein serine/threonine phosphatase n=1 Tax=Stackebrandtia nassauensis (strain DSM 44728 / CIP 108903 / NRRL B-16338 / NBRC 102104 / LLR-40K-21) TaxID=446470 RepID=D3Q014_STANL|nr:PP2C family protein-serine/threonine phosphatase [Stackebrandtia nassauensis]ADD45543.1 protein serine/threonine phosphatase [Stackebrandtia nassauensis DSM 44728]
MAKNGAPWLVRADARTSLGAAIVLLVLIVIVDLAAGPGPDVPSLLVLPPFIAAAFAGWRPVAALGAVCLALGAILILTGDQELSEIPMPLLMDLATLVVSAGSAVVVSVVRQRQQRRWSALSRLASVAQQAVLRPIGPIVGQLELAGRYVSASDHADIGGDLYEAIDTPYGARLIIGDVRGKGLPAVRLASTVLGSFRHVAYERSDLRTVVSDLDRAVARGAGDEDFVTAAFLEMRGGILTILNCGHPPPLLLRQGKLEPLEPPAAAPPLGFMPVAKPLTVRMEPGDRLLLYTDGLAEARRDGVFFPLSERAWAPLGHGSIVDALASLESALRSWVGGPLGDDIALMLVEYIGSDSDAGTSWHDDTSETLAV